MIMTIIRRLGKLELSVAASRARQ